MNPSGPNDSEAASGKLPQTQTTHTLATPAWQGMTPYPQDEIDLVDVGVLLWRRRRIILPVFVVLALLTVIATILKSPTWEYTTTIQIGTRLDNNGNLVPVISSQDAQQILKNTYIPDAIQTYGAQHPDDISLLSGLKVTVHDGNGTQASGIIILLACRAKADHADLCINVEKLAAAAFVKNTSAQTAVIKANYQAQLFSANQNLEAIKNPAVFGAQTLAAKKAIAEAKNNLTDLKSKAALLKLNEDKLNTSQSLYEKEVQQLEQHVAEVNKAGIEAAKQTTGPTQAMSNLLLSTEAQQSVQRLSGIRHTLAVDIPQKLAAVQADIASNTRDQQLAIQTIQQNQNALQKLLFSHQQSIQGTQADIQKIQTDLDNVQASQMLSGALKSFKPVGLGWSAILALGLVLSLILALGAAFCVAYVDQVRARIRSSHPVP